MLESPAEADTIEATVASDQWKMTLAAGRGVILMINAATSDAERRASFFWPDDSRTAKRALNITSWLKRPVSMNEECGDWLTSSPRSTH